MSFISSYIRATEGNESPLSYHLWSCLSCMSVAAGRRFWFNLGRIEYKLNLNVLLVGDPGVKKSTAMDFPKDLIRETGIAPLAASQTTREAIGKMMSHEKFKGKKVFKHEDKSIEYNQLAIFATEFTQFISVNPEGMLEFFTAVYTEKVHSTEYKNAGSDYVLHPYITLLGCLTPHMLKGYLKMNVLTGGFSRRCVFVWGQQERIIPIPQRPPADAMSFLVNWIERLQDKSGEFVFGPGAEEWYCDWYTSLQKNMKDVAKPTTEPYYRTKQELLFKVAMLICLSETEGTDLRILPGHFELAEKNFFKPIEKNLERVFEGSGINPNSTVSVQVCRMLEALNKPMNKKHLLGMFGDQATSWRDLTDTISHLILVGRLEERTLNSNGVLLGTVIGTPQAIQGYTDVELLVFLGREKGPLHARDTDQSPEASPSSGLLDQHGDPIVGSNPKPAPPDNPTDDEQSQWTEL